MNPAAEQVADRDEQRESLRVLRKAAQGRSLGTEPERVVPLGPLILEIVATLRCFPNNLAPSLGRPVVNDLDLRRIGWKETCLKGVLGGLLLLRQEKEMLAKNAQALIPASDLDFVAE